MTKTSNATKLGPLAHQTADLIREHQKNPEKYRPIKTCLTEIDKAIGGFLEGTFCVIGGQWKSGKSTFAQHIATILGVAGRGKVRYYLLEEMRKAFAIRSLTRITTKVTRTDIRDLTLSDEDLDELDKAAKMLDFVDLDVDDSISTIAEIIEEAVRDGIQWVVIDYFQLLMDQSNKKENERLDAISRMIVNARNTHGITFIVVYQLNDKGTAYGSRALYRDADIILEVEVGQEERTDEEVPGTMLAKALRGRSHKKTNDKMEIAFSGAHSRVMDMPTFDAENLTQVPEIPYEQMDIFSEIMNEDDGIYED